MKNLIKIIAVIAFIFVPAISGICQTGELRIYPNVRMNETSEMRITLSSLSELWNDYKTDCYNDSTQVVYCVFKDPKTFVKFNINCEVCADAKKAGSTYIGTTVEYIHRQPDFTEFMDYITQKNKYYNQIPDTIRIHGIAN